MTIEAMKLALETLYMAVEPRMGKVYAREFEPIDCAGMHFEAIKALRAAIEQAERQEIEPDRDCVENDGCPTEKAVLQRFWREHQQAEKQEPVACIAKGCENHRHQGLFIGDLCGPCHSFITKGEGKYSQAYRNTQCNWGGLTDEEIYEAVEVSNSVMVKDMARAIEAKLREKNNA